MSAVGMVQRVGAATVGGALRCRSQRASRPRRRLPGLAPARRRRECNCCAARCLQRHEHQQHQQHSQTHSRAALGKSHHDAHTRLAALFPGLPRRAATNQNGKTNLDFTEARDSEWQWHQLGRMQVCILLQTDNHASTHASTQPLKFFYRPDALLAAQPTASRH